MSDKRPTTSLVLPRALNRVHAAQYLDLSPGTFDALVEAKKLPKPRNIIVTEACRPMKRWDRLELDAAFDEIGTPEANANPGGLDTGHRPLA